jgi:broad specificity phosphatase PhoE
MVFDASENWPPPPRRRVYLMRHAEVEYFDAEGRPRYPDHVSLNEAGEKQASAAEAALAEVAFDRVICSGLPRTEQTARIVLGERTVPIEVEPRLREIEPGRFPDIGAAPPELVRQAILGALSDRTTPESRFLGGETFGACEERVSAAWGELLAAPGWQNALVVAHGVVNRLLLARELSLPLRAIARLEQDAACINIIDVCPARGALVRLVNATALNLGKVGMQLSTLEGLYRQYLRGR